MADFEIEVVGGSQFVDERVEVDGREFVECRFTRCTFVFRGTGPFMFVRSKIEDSIFEIEEPARTMFEALSVAYNHGMDKWVDGLFERVRKPFTIQ